MRPLKKLLTAIERHTVPGAERNYYLKLFGFEIRKDLVTNEPACPDERMRRVRMINNSLRPIVHLWNEKPYEMVNNKVVKK
jgi:hypothetical protein